VPPFAEIRRDHVVRFMEATLAERTAGTAHNRFRALRRWFAWLVTEGELDMSPMLGMKAPQLPTEAPDVLPKEAIEKMLAACSDRDFASRRDAAIIRFLVDTGCRRAEVAGMTLSSKDFDLDQQVARVVGKGKKARVVAFGAKAARDLDRYLRVRATHPQAGARLPVRLGGKDETAPAFWVGKRGAMTGSGIYQVVRERAHEAGIEERIFAHLFRSTFADMWLEAGGNEGDLMALAGWDSMTMLRRYTAKRRAERAQNAHRDLSPGDRIS